MAVDDVRGWVREYRGRGYAVCRLRRGEKRPAYPAWNRRSLEADDFRPGDNVGLQAGALSGNVVCIDIDHPDALALAPRYLPPTAMAEGRPGKPNSHLWYRVASLLPEETAPPSVAGGLGGPRTRRLKRPDGVTLVEVVGTGVQAAVPASVWTSKDGNATERRVWHEFGEPATLEHAELLAAVYGLASACGWAGGQKVRPGPRRARAAAGEAPDLPLPASEAARQARAYLAKVPPAVEGQGGDARTFFAACVLAVEFGLPVEEALPVMTEWGKRCEPPWTVPELARKLEAAAKVEGERGWRVRRRASRVVVSLRPGDTEVYVGVGCRGDRSFIDLPTMRAGLRRVGEGRELAPELAEIDWHGRHITLAPPSTVTTNMREAWDEYFLARLLLLRGAAAVECLRIPPLNGRRRTLAEAGDVDWEVVQPPRNAAQAAERAGQAGRLARELDATRRALPRVRASPRLEAARRFVSRHGVTALTKEVLAKARKKGVSKDALRRALGKKVKPPPSISSVL